MEIGNLLGKSKAPAWITFAGVVLFLVGLYLAGRTAVNFLLFTRYPTSGVFPINTGSPVSYQKEEDCDFSYYPQNPDRLLTDEEFAKEQMAQNELCLASVREGRNQAKANDISQSLFFLFLGAGILASRKTFF